MYVKIFKIDMSLFKEENPCNYPTLNALFIREKKDIEFYDDEDVVCSPSDGLITEYGEIEENKAYQIKGKSYDITELIPNNKLNGGFFINIYLSPKDYHRYHTPIDMQVLSATHIPGALYPVNIPSLQKRDNLFIKNERVVLKCKDKKERIGRIMKMHAIKREEVKEIYAGEIGAVVGLKSTITGDTLASDKDPVVLERMDFPEPVISVAVEPKTKADQEKMGIALGKLAQEDPSFRVATDEESGQTIISGMGELHLEILVDRMKREFAVEAEVGAPQVAYRETIKNAVNQEYKYSKQSGGKGQYGHVYLRIEPMTAEETNEEGFEFVSEIKGGSIPKEYIPAVEKGCREALEGGVIAGYAMEDVKVVLYDGSYHDVDSNEMAFKIAGSIRCRDSLRRMPSCFVWVLLGSFLK